MLVSLRRRRGSTVPAPHVNPASMGLPTAAGPRDQHAAALFCLALAVAGDRQRAENAVVAVVSAMSRRWSADPDADTRRDLVQRVYWLCTAERPGEPAATPPSVADQQGAALALVRFGGLTYREVADLMELAPVDVAHLLSAALREI